MSNDETLANFQAVVPNVDTAVALSILEATNWDLNEAINMALAAQPEDLAHPQPSHTGPSNGAAAAGPTAAASVSMDEENPWEILRTGLRDPVPAPGPSQGPANQDSPSTTRPAAKSARFVETANGTGKGALAFNLHFNGRLIYLPEVSSNLTVAGLLQRIADTVCATGGDPENLRVSGWLARDPDFTPPPDMRLQEMGMTGTLDLTVSRKDEDPALAAIGPELLEKRFRFAVQNLTDGGTIYRFVLPGAQTLSELKQTSGGLSNILPSRQQWTGFPADTSNDTILAAVKWERHDTDGESILLSLDVAEPSVSTDASTSIATARSTDHTLVSSDEDDDDYAATQSASMEFLEDEGEPGGGQAPLIPAGLSDPIDAIANFTIVFESRFPHKVHPPFYQGSLGEALAATNADPTQGRRPFALYLHNDAAVAANIFCEQVLCSDQLSTLLSQNFVIWPWDITQRENADLLLNWVTGLTGGSVDGEIQLPAAFRDFNRHNRMTAPWTGMEQGSFGVGLIRWLLGMKDQAPFLILLGRNKATWHCVGKLRGTSSAQEAVELAMEAMEAQHGFNTADEQDRVNAAEREAFRNTQQSEYEATLAADQEREMERQRQELEAKAAAKQAAMAQEAEETARASLGSLLPDEPSADDPNPVAAIKLRLPDGSVQERRFRGSEELKVLFMWTGSLGYPESKYKLLTSFPKRDLAGEETTRTLESLKLCPREQLTIDER